MLRAARKMGRLPKIESFAMKKAWKTIDLEGDGLQTVNQRLSTALKRRGLAYAGWLLFLLGIHRHYLDAHGSALLYPLLTALCGATWFLLHSPWALLPGLAIAALAVYDLFWIDRRLTRLNKAIRMHLYLGAGAAAPAGYRGRYTEEGGDTELGDYLREKEKERAGILPVEPDTGAGRPRRKVPSFAEQEAMLRELARQRRDKDR